ERAVQPGAALDDHAAELARPGAAQADVQYALAGLVVGAVDSQSTGRPRPAGSDLAAIDHRGIHRAGAGKRAAQDVHKAIRTQCGPRSERGAGIGPHLGVVGGETEGAVLNLHGAAVREADAGIEPDRPPARL